MKNKDKKGWQVSLKGIDFEMPVEIGTSEGVQKVNLGLKPMLIKSQTAPEVDPNYWYMLKR